MIFGSKHAMSVAVFAAAAWGFSTGFAHAYLDPGTGSFFLQMLIGALAGGFFAIKMYWAKVKTFFGQRAAADTKDEAS